MDVTRVLQVTRRYLDQSDLLLSTYTDSELLEYIRDGQELMSVREFPTIAGLTVDPTTLTITPEPSLDQGHVLALKAAVLALTDTYNGKLSRGELGLSWKSGLEEESTINSEKAWKQSISDLAKELEELIIIKRAPTTGTRPQ